MKKKGRRGGGLVGGGPHGDAPKDFHKLARSGERAAVRRRRRHGLSIIFVTTCDAHARGETDDILANVGNGARPAALWPTAEVIGGGNLLRQ